ncbi:hypothetical protein TD95_002997 [Thielaviopsis punctulata]|uniref:Uncharacterized protein n=1 Tax=Thielaviopsis punctulata TaxID=72032 RepID=A0A0F4ZJC3_9PEZI|nr:hypothetical protein TD95_002997 [Thielaviopsis punctulata]
MSSTMRNAVQRRPHRERAQPLERKKLGLLEKKKDYTLRAKDFNKKKAQLKSLRAKAATRNEDEFYFGMLSRAGPGTRLSQGRAFNGLVRGDRGNKALDLETARLLKTQDIAYIRSVRTHLAKEVARLQQQIVLAQGIAPDGNAAVGVPGKIVFADDAEERRHMMGDIHEDEQHDDDDDDDDDMDLDLADFDPANMDAFGGWSSDEEDAPKKKPAKDNSDDNKDKKEEKESREAIRLRKMQNRLAAMQDKLAALARAEQLMNEQQAKMAKTATSGGVNKKGKKIMVRTRKR